MSVFNHNDDNAVDQRQKQVETPINNHQPQRRTFLHTFLTGVSALATTTSLSQPALAAAAADSNNALFRPNPLTNSVLEQVRIWEQAEADDRKYGGELERGEAGKNLGGQDDYYPSLLVPILDIAQDLDRLVGLLQPLPAASDPEASLQQAQQILNQVKFEKVAFKKIFNAFGDNIYYSDPDRANLYLGGGATPKNSQSLAYLLRNEILTNVEDMRAEVGYLLKTVSSSQDSDGDTSDMRQMAKTAQRAMNEYLAVVPPVEIEKAKTLIAAKKQ